MSREVVTKALTLTRGAYSSLLETSGGTDDTVYAAALADVQRIHAGNVSRDELLADCLAGVEADDSGREESWRDYVSAVWSYGREHDGSALTIEVTS